MCFSRPLAYLWHRMTHRYRCKARAETGDEFEIIARYLVGCDGANSFVRKHLGVRVGRSRLRRMVDGGGYAHERSRQETCQELSVLLAVASGHLCARPGKSAALGDQAIAGRRSGSRWCAGQRAQIAERLYGYVRPHDLAFGGLSLPRTARTSLARSACFLMGDAVHQTPPFLGQGLCAGIRDAVNLAWKLALVCAAKPVMDCSTATRPSASRMSAQSSRVPRSSARSSASWIPRQRSPAMSGCARNSNPAKPKRSGKNSSRVLWVA